MKFVVVVGDGMTDVPVAELSGATPLEVARTPNMDEVARSGVVGLARTVPEGYPPASDVGNLSILGYDPRRHYTGRGPLEAANLGIVLGQDAVAFRCNLVTVANGRLVDYSAGHISSPEAARLIAAVHAGLGTAGVQFHAGVQYRHIAVIKKGVAEGGDLTAACHAPHAILDQEIERHLPQGSGAGLLRRLMEASRPILEAHEVNRVRLDLKENPANMIWLWGQGGAPQIPSFRSAYGLSGAVISAVDLINGIGRLIGFEVIRVPGATGYYDTNYQGKAEYAIRALERVDFVFVHIEATDEAGHNGHLREKITAIERLDQYVVGPLLAALRRQRAWRLLIIPDHATSVVQRMHLADPVCFAMCGTGVEPGGIAQYQERAAEAATLRFAHGFEVMGMLTDATGGRAARVTRESGRGGIPPG